MIIYDNKIIYEGHPAPPARSEANSLFDEPGLRHPWSKPVTPGKASPHLPILILMLIMMLILMALAMLMMVVGYMGCYE